MADDPQVILDLIANKTDFSNPICQKALTTIQTMAKEGVSSELPEIVGICSRVIVMHDGRITGELEDEDVTQKNIMELAIS